MLREAIATVEDTMRKLTEASKGNGEVFRKGWFDRLPLRIERNKRFPREIVGLVKRFIFGSRKGEGKRKAFITKKMCAAFASLAVTSGCEGLNSYYWSVLHKARFFPDFPGFCGRVYYRSMEWNWTLIEKSQVLTKLIRDHTGDGPDDFTEEEVVALTRSKVEQRLIRSFPGLDAAAPAARRPAGDFVKRRKRRMHR